jgi:hypothetical protein
MSGARWTCWGDMGVIEREKKEEGVVLGILGRYGLLFRLDTEVHLVRR